MSSVRYLPLDTQLCADIGFQFLDLVAKVHVVTLELVDPRRLGLSSVDLDVASHLCLLMELVGHQDYAGAIHLATTDIRSDGGPGDVHQFSFQAGKILVHRDGGQRDDDHRTAIGYAIHRRVLQDVAVWDIEPVTCAGLERDDVGILSQVSLVVILSQSRLLVDVFLRILVVGKDVTETPYRFALVLGVV